MSKLILSILFLHYSFIAWSQDWPLKKMVQEKKATGIHFNKLEAFTLIGDRTIPERGVYQQLKLKEGFYEQLKNEASEAIQLTIPLSNTRTVECELVKTNLGNVRFTMNRDQQVYNVIPPLCYRGIVMGEESKNNVMFTVNENYLSLIITYSDKAIQITKANESQREIYRLYNSELIEFPTGKFECGTQPPSEIVAVQRATPNAPEDKCVYVFVECFDSLYQWRNSNYQNTINYVYELFNSVATGYLNERINLKISTINVWTVADPYRQTNRNIALADLSGYYRDNFWGNICVGLDFSLTLPDGGRSGVAGSATGRVKGEAPNSCPAYTDSIHQFCYNDMNYFGNYQNFPTGPNTTAEQIYLVMHEIGHLLGSPHTQWCGWPGGAIDNCAAVEGTCMPGPPPPASGGTIMSYCVFPGQFVNFNNGFGTIPGNAIRNFVDGSPCITNCPSCPVDVTVGDLGMGPNHFEVSNQISANGTLPAASITVLDAGSRVRLLPGFRATRGSRLNAIINGCRGIR